MTARRTVLILAGLAGVFCAPAAGERIKDIVDIKGIRSNPLWGYGLVIGLNGTGDNSPASRRALTNILRQKGLVLQPDDLASKNIASVIVTTELPAFARRGSRIDVTVSTIGSASSLSGGKLLLTELVGADGQVYAVAQGSVTTGAVSAGGEKATITKNHPTVGRVDGGATVEREEVSEIVEKGEITLLLRNPDFTTANKIAQEVNKLYEQSSYPADAGTVRVKLPKTVGPTNLSMFIDRVGALLVESDMPAMVVINERTGTIIVGENVGVSRVAISHGNLSIITEEKENVSQPNSFSNTGKTEKTKETKLKAVEEKGTLNVVNRTVSVAELARALNSMGLTPRDLVAIFEALKKAGALQAELKVM
jgi:flagellar P-ring protein precursor FlgI